MFTTNFFTSKSFCFIDIFTNCRDPVCFICFCNILKLLSVHSWRTEPNFFIKSFQFHSVLPLSLFLSNIILSRIYRLHFLCFCSLTVYLFWGFECWNCFFHSLFYCFVVIGMNGCSEYIQLL